MKSLPKIAIVGLGLLGGSLGLALRGKAQRLGWARRAETRTRALELGVVDQVFETPEELLFQADLTVLALPLQAAGNFMKKYAPSWQKGSVVTDVGSLKQEVLTAAATYLAPRGIVFVGSHPMAGTEKSGIDAAFAELYNNADVFIVPPENTPESAKKLVETMWQQVGGHPFTIPAAQHDQLVARTSHVLHIVASALTRSILGATEPETRLQRFHGCATGFRDCCRIASSNPAMWREIIADNKVAVLQAMDDFETSYAAMRQQIEENDFSGFERDFAEGKALRDSWMEYKRKSKEK